MKKRILASLLALCLMGGMLPTAALASEPDTTMPTTEQKSEKNNGAHANRAPSAPASAGAEGNFSEPLLVRAGEEDTPTSGTCGENLTWELDLETGTLTISGTGEMFSYDITDYNRAPWYVYRNDIYEIHISNNVTSIGSSAFRGCWRLSSISIPEGVNKIDAGAFVGCESLAEINIPDSVTYIGANAFQSCRGLISIDIPDGIAGIESYTFDGCISLTGVNIPTSVTYIRSAAFQKCMSLVGIMLPDGITTIDSYTFSGCNNLTSISIPASVKYIQYDAFAECSSLADIYYSGSDTQWSTIEIGCYLPEVTIHYNSTGPDTGTTTPDGRITSVKYLTTWDETSKTAVFSDDSYIRYTAAADAELPSDGITQLVNRYVLVECAQDESDVNRGQLFRLQPVNSALGSLTAGTETTVTIDGVTYEWPDGIGMSGPGAPYEVLYHTIDGRLVGYTVLAEKKGTAGDWNGSDTVHLDGVDFHTNYMTDQDSLAEISKIADKD